MKKLLFIFVLLFTVCQKLPAQIIQPAIAFGQNLNSLSSGLIVRWRMNECSGTSVTDSAGSLTGTWHGTPSGGTGNGLASFYSQGFVGSCAGTFNHLSATTADNYVSTTATTNTNFITVAFWMSPNEWTTQYSTVIANTDSTPPYAAFQFYKRDVGAANPMLSCSLAVGGTTYALDIANIQTLSMQHVALTYDGTTIRTYYNGVEQHTQAASGTIDITSTNIGLGYNPSFAGRFYTGLLDDVLLYSRALTVTEIKKLYNSQRIVNAYVPTWTRQGTVISTAGSWIPNVIYEGNPQILGPGNVFKMWYGNIANANLYYAESADGSSWTAYSGNPVQATCKFAKIYKDASTYYAYCNNALGTSEPIKVYTSSDGLSWSLANSNAIVSTNSSWDVGGVLQLGIAGKVAGTWYGYFGASNADSTTWSTGLATSTDLVNWTVDPGNPVAALSGGTNWQSSGDIHFVSSGGTYYGWSQVTLLRYGIDQFPSDILRWSSSAITGPWVPTAKPTYWRTGTEEGVGDNLGQVADPYILEVSGTTYMFYTGVVNGGGSSAIIRLATYAGTIAQLVQTKEGIIGSTQRWP